MGIKNTFDPVAVDNPVIATDHIRKIRKGGFLESERLTVRADANFFNALTVITNYYKKRVKKPQMGLMIPCNRFEDIKKDIRTIPGSNEFRNAFLLRSTKDGESFNLASFEFFMGQPGQTIGDNIKYLAFEFKSMVLQPDGGYKFNQPYFIFEK